MSTAPGSTRTPHGSVDAMLAGAADRAAWAKNADSLSGSPFERVTIDGRPYIVKHIDRETDWIMRALDDGLDGRAPYVLVMWQAGLLDALPACIDHTIEAMAWDRSSQRLAVLMRDESAAFVPIGGTPIPLEQHRGFLDAMAQMHAAFWGFTDEYGLLPPGARYTALTPAMAAREAAAGYADPVPRLIPGGWAALAAAAPEAHEIALALATDPAPLVAALDETPATFVHGDWKYGNLGTHPDGRTVLVDWGWPGRGGPGVDLAWYLAVNCDRLPESKADTVRALRDRLEHHGIETRDWWDRQIEVALVGGFVQLGWSKTHDPAELAWWVERIVPVGRELLG